MIKTPPIGLYIEKNSFIHALDPRIKIIISFFLTFTSIYVKSINIQLLLFFLILFISFFTKIKLTLILKSIKPMLYILSFTFIFNIILAKDEAFFSFYFIKISYNSIYTACFLVLKIINIVLSSSILTLTTSPFVLTYAFESLCLPLKKIKIPIHEIAMIINMVLRFVPVLFDETDKLIKAQSSRGVDFDTKNLIKKFKNLFPLVIPILICSFRRAEDLANAMSARCYRGDINRTHFHSFSLNKYDIMSLCISILCLMAIIYFDFFYFN